MLEKDDKSGKHIMRIDASLYKESDCEQFVRYKLIEGLVAGGVPSTNDEAPTKDAAMEYGTAFHKGLQARAEGKDINEQLKIVTTHFSQPGIFFKPKEWRNIGHLVSTYVGYDSAYKQFDQLVPIVRDGKVLVEQRFMFPFYKTEKTEVLLCGTIDMIATIHGMTVIVDHKTTGAWDVDEYMNEYILSPQLMIYKWVYDRLHNTDAGCVINGVFIGGKKPAVFRRSDIIMFSPEQVGNCIAHVTARVKRTVESFESGEPVIPNYTQCVKKYGDKAKPCQFMLLCQQRTAGDREFALSNYGAKVYNPMEWQT